MVEAGFSLGSNLGNRLDALRAASCRICSIPGTMRLGLSSVYETVPVGVPDEFSSMMFLNAVLVVSTTLLPEQWLEHIQMIEADLGRVRSGNPNEPRTIDVDLIYWGDLLVDSAALTVPHPRWSEREFVVRPLADVRPDFRLPSSNRTVRQVLDEMHTGGVTRFAEQW